MYWTSTTGIFLFRCILSARVWSNSIFFIWLFTLTVYEFVQWCSLFKHFDEFNQTLMPTDVITLYTKRILGANQTSFIGISTFRPISLLWVNFLNLIHHKIEKTSKINGKCPQHEISISFDVIITILLSICVASGRAAVVTWLSIVHPVLFSFFSATPLKRFSFGEYMPPLIQD